MTGSVFRIETVAMQNADFDSPDIATRMSSLRALLSRCSNLSRDFCNGVRRSAHGCP